jgi:hypothetical protein
MILCSSIWLVSPDKGVLVGIRHKSSPHSPNDTHLGFWWSSRWKVKRPVMRKRNKNMVFASLVYYSHLWPPLPIPASTSIYLIFYSIFNTFIIRFFYNYYSCKSELMITMSSFIKGMSNLIVKFISLYIYLTYLWIHLLFIMVMIFTSFNIITKSVKYLVHFYELISFFFCYSNNLKFFFTYHIS